jgi:hypothetical protein
MHRWQPPCGANGKFASSRTFSKLAKSPQVEFATKLHVGGESSLPTGSAGE